MAEMNLEAEIAAGMQRQLVGLEAQIQSQADKWVAITTGALRYWEHATQEMREVWSGDRGSSDMLVPKETSPELLHSLWGFVQHIGADNKERDAASAEEAMYRDPAYAAYVAQQNARDAEINAAIDRMENPPWLPYEPTEAELRARDVEAYESRGSDPRVEAAQEQLFAQQSEQGEWAGWNDPSA
jgi:hypothetical protein